MIKEIALYATKLAGANHHFVLLAKGYLAFGLARIGSIDEAEDILTRTIGKLIIYTGDSSPQLVTARAFLSYVYIQQGRFDEALEQQNICIEKHSDLVQGTGLQFILFFKAMTYLSMGNALMAESTFDAAFNLPQKKGRKMELNETVVYILRGYVRVLQLRGKHTKAAIFCIAVAFGAIMSGQTPARLWAYNIAA
jgi:tetratricopeptide (TPR) repeat protein